MKASSMLCGLSVVVTVVFAPPSVSLGELPTRLARTEDPDLSGIPSGPCHSKEYPMLCFANAWRRGQLETLQLTVGRLDLSCPIAHDGQLCKRLANDPWGSIATSAHGASLGCCDLECIEKRSRGLIGRRCTLPKAPSRPVDLS